MRVRILFPLILLLTLAGTSPAVSQPITRPPGEGPIDVGVGIYVVDITALNEVDNTFTSELDVVASWVDPRLAFDPVEAGASHLSWFGSEAVQKRNTIWNAQISAVNIYGEMRIGQSNLTISSDGRVTVRGRVTASLRAPLDFHRFPFDSQVLPIRLQSYSWNQNIVRLHAIDGESGFDPEFDLPEWNVLGVRTSSTEHVSARDVVPFSRVSFEIDVERKSGYYVWKIILPLLVIVTITWVVFYMEGERLGRRAGVLSTGILTVIAYQFVATSSLPRLPYLTAIDRLMLLSILTIGAAMVVSILADRVAGDNAERARRVDIMCRWAFPLVYYGGFVIFSLTRLV